MFESLRAAFREAIENFKEELNRDQVPEAVDDLLRGMRVEVTEAKTRLHDLEAGVRRALAEAGREGQEAETCRRREEMAERIGDTETARVAAEFRAKHSRRKEVLETKAAALQQELEVRKGEIEDMVEQLREAQTKRESLAAEAGRSTARNSIRGAEDLFDELDRMAERIGDEKAREDAADDLLDDLDDLGVSTDRGSSASSTRSGADVDARLAELKRRMGRE